MSGTRSPPTQRILIENIGPFKKASLELKPLTILIGVNSVGKSMLMYLAWAVMSLEPDIAALGEATRSLGALEMAKRLAELVKRGRDPTAELRQLLRVFVRALPKADTLQAHHHRRAYPG